LRVLVPEKLADPGVTLLQKDFDVDVLLDLSPEELLEKIGEYDGLIIRSATQVTAEVIDRAENLKAIGRAGIGVDNIDIEAATKRGVIVANAPESNTVAAAEHTLGLMLAAARRIPAADASLKGGEWKRSAFKGVEVREKTLGLVGLGHVGAIVARGAIGMGMKVLAYDPYVSEDRMRSMNVERAETTDEVFENADFVSLHVPRTPQTVGLVNAETLAKMKPTAYLINVARGGIVDEDGALRGAEKRCHRRGGARRLRGGADDGVPDLLPPQRRSHPAPGGQHRRGPGPGRHNGGRAGRDGLAGPGPDARHKRPRARGRGR
jgi:D-3-phosphoglycerate dehydrogenase